MAPGRFVETQFQLFQKQSNPMYQPFGTFQIFLALNLFLEEPVLTHSCEPSALGKVQDVWVGRENRRWTIGPLSWSRLKLHHAQSSAVATTAGTTQPVERQEEDYPEHCRQHQETMWKFTCQTWHMKRRSLRVSCFASVEAQLKIMWHEATQQLKTWPVAIFHAGYKDAVLEKLSSL